MIVSGLRRALDAEGFRAVQHADPAALSAWKSEPISPTPIGAMPTEALKSHLPVKWNFSSARSNTAGLP